MPRISTKYQRPRLALGAFSRGFVVGGTPAAPAVTWNPSDRDADITLSGSNLIASSTGAAAQGSIRATLGRSTGLYYFEARIDAIGNAFILVGAAKASFTVSGQYLGEPAAVESVGYFGVDGTALFSASGGAYGTTYTTGDVIGVAINFTTGKIWFSKNNTWQNSGDPVAGTGQAWAGITGEYFPALSMFTNTYQVTGRFKVSSFTYSPPTGFSAWES